MNGNLAAKTNRPPGEFPTAYYQAERRAPEIIGVTGIIDFPVTLIHSDCYTSVRYSSAYVRAQRSKLKSDSMACVISFLRAASSRHTHIA